MYHVTEAGWTKVRGESVGELHYKVGGVEGAEGGCGVTESEQVQGPCRREHATSLIAVLRLPAPAPVRTAMASPLAPSLDLRQYYPDPLVRSSIAVDPLAT